MNSRYINMFYIFIVLAFVLLVLSIFLFIRFNIPKVIGDLTGRTSQKAIEKTRKRNQNSGIKEYKASKVNIRRGKITDKITDAGTVKKSDIVYGGVVTDAIGDSMNTSVLNHQSATTVLSDSVAAEDTTVLGAYNYNEQPQKSNDATAKSNNILTDNSDFVIEEDISFTDSPEIIV